MIADIRPNPLGRSASIRLSLPRDGWVRLSVYDLAGQRVRTLVDGERGAGGLAVTWDRADDTGRAVPAGVYFCRLEAEGTSVSRKLVVR